jgi:rhodanese-related sulfurtransferase
MLEIAPVTLQHLLHQGSQLALLDVREPGEYNAAHIPGAAPLPRRLIEHRIERLVPHRDVQVVVCDDTGQRARLAARTLERIGYTRVAVLDDGINRWASEDHPTEWGINVPSKDFGEMVEVREHVPTVDARELHRWIERGDDLVILDTRTPEEFRRFCIPGGRNVPNGELAYRIGEITRERPNARVVVNCAGRTRSIIGTRALQRMGLPGVVGLKNGTSGWVLAGLTLESGADRVELPEPTSEGRTEAEAHARRVMDEDGVQVVGVDALPALIADAEREPAYLVDVRTREGFEAGHIPGFWWFPGGQAVQRTDELVAVRGAKIVFACDGIARSGITASWFRQMGFPNVVAVEGGTSAWTAAGQSLERGPSESDPWGLADARAAVRAIEPSALRELPGTAAPPQVIHVGSSREFAASHVPGARWIPRGWLEPRVEALVPDWTEPIVVTDVDTVDAYLAASTLREIGYHDVAVLAGGMPAWQSAGLPVEQGLSGVMEPPDDVLPAGPERSYADMIEYLRWETALGEKYAT